MKEKIISCGVSIGQGLTVNNWTWTEKVWFLTYDPGIKNGQASIKKRKLIGRRVSQGFSKELEITFWTVWTLDE